MSTAPNTLHEPSFSSGLRALAFAIARCRFSALVLAAGAILLLTDQGRDLLIAYGEDGKTVRFTAGVFVWAFSIWGWARVLLDIEWPELPSCIPCYNAARKWLPRIMGAAAFALVVFSAFQANQAAIAFWSLGGMVAFFVLVWKRREWAHNLVRAAKQRNLRSLATAAQLFEAEQVEAWSMPPYRTFRDALRPAGLRQSGEIPVRWVIFVAMVLAWLMFFVAATFFPVWIGGSGAMILLFFWGATWLPVGSLLSYYADRVAFPLLTALGVLALVSSCFNDNHEIRRAPNAIDVAKRPDVADTLAAWGKANAAPDATPTPFVIVATAGGGIRAAYWTGVVLGALHDDLGDELPRRLFAVSGVSGGSVGATTWRALAALPPAEFAKACPKRMGDCVERILGHDLLGPISAALLYPDLVQRFIPYPVMPDRGAAFEEGLENAFRKETGTAQLETTLAALSEPQPWPALFLNATWVGNGRRIVASNLRYGYGPEGAVFERANDQLKQLGRDLRLSTAAHNSARFPFVSPPGMWKREGEIQGRLQDGGLFENYGAETALEILTLACRTMRCVPAPGAPVGVVGATAKMPRNVYVATDAVLVYPVVILISSDPTLPEQLAESPLNAPLEFAYEVRSTVRTYERARTGHGQEAASRLQEWTQNNGGKFYYFRMCDPKSPDAQPPLGWALSERAKQRIVSYLRPVDDPDLSTPSCQDWNSGSLKDIVRLLGDTKRAPGG